MAKKKRTSKKKKANYNSTGGVGTPINYRVRTPISQHRAPIDRVGRPIHNVPTPAG